MQTPDLAQIVQPTQEGVCPLDTATLCEILANFAQMLSGKLLYNYQRGPAVRAFESILEHDGSVITILFARQCIGPDQIVTQRDGTLTRMVQSERSWLTKKQAKVYNLRIKGGACIDEVTKDHIFFTRSGERPLRELKVGDEIAIVTKVDSWLDDQYLEGIYKHKTAHKKWDENHQYLWTPELALLLGYMASDGYCCIGNNQSPKFTNNDPEYLKDFQRVAEACLPGTVVKWREKGTGYDLYPYSGKRTATTSAFKTLLGVADFDNGFPRAIARTNPALVGAFFRGIMHGDGCVQPGRECLEIAAGNNRVYARYLQALLLKLGVRSSVKKEMMNKGTAPFYRIIISGAENCVRLTSYTGVLGGHKFDAHSALLERFASKSEEGGKGHCSRHMYPTEGVGPDGENIAFSKIISIDPGGTTDVYDREEPDKGWFVCQGIKTHNSGKSEVVAAIISTLMVLLPLLSRTFPNDVRFSLIDPNTHRVLGYATGFRCGVFGPKKEQADIIYNRIREFFVRQEAVDILAALEIQHHVANGKMSKLSNGSYCCANTANDGASIEGDSYHLIITDETQKISDQMIIKSILPMGASVNASYIHIGTAGIGRCYFLETIKKNRRDHAVGATKSHFEISWVEASNENIWYRQHVKMMKRLIGERSDEFRQNYENKFILERGMFVDEDVLAKIIDTDREAGDWKTIGQLKRQGKLSVIAGIDFGKQHDCTVLTLGLIDFDYPILEEEVQNEQEWKIITHYGIDIIEWHSFEGDDYETQFYEIENILRNSIPHGLPVRKLALDATGCGVPIVDRFNARYPGIEIVPVSFSTQSKDLMYRNLIRGIRSGHYRIPGGPATKASRHYIRFTQEMLDLEKTYNNGMMVVRHPDVPNAHDDYADSLALLAHAGSSRPAIGEVECLDNTLFRSRRNKHAR